MPDIIILGLEGEEFDPMNINGYTLEQLQAFLHTLQDEYLADVKDDSVTVQELREHENIPHFKLIKDRIEVLNLNTKLEAIIKGIPGRLQFFKERGLNRLLEEALNLISNKIEYIFIENKESLVAELKNLPPHSDYDKNKNLLLELLGENQES